MPKLLKNLTATFVLIASMALTGTAHAQYNCTVPGNSFDDVYCLTRVYVKADDELTVAYQRLLKRLPASAQATLRRTERAWIASRNADCTAQDSRRGDIIYIGCAVDRTISRTNFLNDRYRECVSVGCQPAKLNE
ncbi:lysozyme inhibitor LprI family protein [Deinococcus sp.]|uniref:lysozyme inhibitor LprI family protein n=1 Tax=Deinococcus sp. TaxID=47478 RepID=UPI003CC62270